MSQGEMEEVGALRDKVKFVVGKYCEKIQKERNATFSKEFIYCAGELLFTHMESIAFDLEKFALHAKKSTISAEDVLLCVRRNPSREALLQSKIEALEETKKIKQRKKRKKTSESIEITD